MAIVKDRGALPKGDTREGEVPTPGAPFSQIVADGMQALMLEERGYGELDVRPMARQGARFRHSDAAGCARQLAYKMTKAEVTNPPGIVDKINMHVGTVLGAMLQRAVAKEHPGAMAEVICGFDNEDGTPLTAGHIDIVYGDPVVAVETKTVGGFAHKLAIGERGQAQGPAWGAKVQGALNATAIGADELVVFNFAKEIVSKGLAEKKGIPELERGLASWSYGPDEFRPIAERELKRVRRVIELVDNGEVVPRAIDDPEIPREARIVDPMTGRWEIRTTGGDVSRSGTYYLCGAYCSYRDRCQADLEAGC